MLSNLYNFTKRTSNCIFCFISSFPEFCKKQLELKKEYFLDTRYRLQNLSSTNLELGIYHLYSLNLIDAIIRFKLVYNFLDKGNKEACYWLGWCYFIKNNLEKAAGYLEKCIDPDAVLLLNFIKNHNDYDEIPQKIWQLYRDITNENYTRNFDSDDIHLPYRFIQKTTSYLKNLPDNYNVLELGSNIGLVGYEVKKRFPNNFTLKATEISQEMIDSSELYYKNIRVYDVLQQEHIPEYMKNISEKFDVILSFCGLSFTKKPQDCFNMVYKQLNDQGYFAFCLPIASKTFFSIQRKEFVFNRDELESILVKSKFKVALYEEVQLNPNNRYIMCVSQKYISEL